MTKSLLKSLLSAALLGAALSAQAAPTLTVGSATGAPGNVVNIPVTLNNVDSDVVGLQLDITYDDTQLTPAEATSVAVAGSTNGLAFSKVQGAGGVIRVVVADFTNTTPLTAGNALLPSAVQLMIPFTIDGAASTGVAPLPLVISNVKYSDAANLVVVAGALTDGEVDVENFTLCDSAPNDLSGDVISGFDVNATFLLLGSLISANPAANCHSGGAADPTEIDGFDVNGTFLIIP